jgi:hypothetical protein
MSFKVFNILILILVHSENIFYFQHFYVWKPAIQNSEDVKINFTMIITFNFIILFIIILMDALKPNTQTFKY